MRRPGKLQEENLDSTYNYKCTKCSDCVSGSRRNDAFSFYNKKKQVPKLCAAFIFQRAGNKKITQKTLCSLLCHLQDSQNTIAVCVLDHTWVGL